MVARGLPFRPLDLSVEQRVKVTNPSGNPEGYGTVMGPTYGETTIDGFWKDKFLSYGPSEVPPIRLTGPCTGQHLQGEGTPVTSAQEAVHLLESMVAEGQEVEVSWAFVLRRGYLKKFDTKIHNIHDVEWSATFAWISKARVNSVPMFGPPAGQLETGRSLFDRLARFARVLDTPRQLVAEHMASFRNTINAVAATSQAIDDSLSGLAAEASAATEINRVRGMLGGIAQSAQNVVDSVEAAGWAGMFTDIQRVLPFSDYNINRTDTGFWAQQRELDLAAIDPEELLQAQLYTRETITDARRLRDEAEARARAMATPVSESLGTYRAREGEDLRDVSRLYYGTPDQWRTLMLYNEMTTTELYPGQTIAIPRVDAQNTEAA